MNRHVRYRMTGLVTVSTLLAAPAAVPASASTAAWSFCDRSLDVRYLPHTPDAVEGWLARCPAAAPEAPSGLPRTADAAEAWSR